MCSLGAAKLGAWILLKTRDPIPGMKTKDHVERIGGDMPKLVVKNEDGVYCGINKEGVAVVCSATEVDGKVGEVFVGDIIVEVLDEKSSKDAVEKIKNISRKIQGNYIIADVDECYAVEYFKGEVEVHELEKTGALANHYIKIDKGYRKKEEYPSTFLRLERMEGLVAGAKNLEDIKNILKDHANGPGSDSICRHGEERFTQSAFILDTMNATLYYCDGNPCEGEFKEFNLE